MQVRKTLVLDQGYQPLNIVPFTRALTYISKDKVEILADYDEFAHEDFLKPAVVRLTHNVKRHKQRIKFSRQNVLIRDKFMCQYCGKTAMQAELTYDHVVPRAQGGTTCWENIAIACMDCNSQKANRTPAQAGMTLRVKPARPSWIPVYNTRLLRVGDVPEEWADYWTIELEA